MKISIDEDLKKEFDINDEDFEGLANANDLKSLEHAIMRLGANEQDCIFGNPYMNGNYLYDIKTKEGYWDFITDYTDNVVEEGKKNYLRLEVCFNMLNDNLKEQEEYDTEDLKNLKIKVTKVGYKEIEEYDA